MYAKCGPRKYKFDLDDFEQHLELPHEGFSDYLLQHDFPSDIPVNSPTELNLLLNHNRKVASSSGRADAAWQGYLTGDERFTLSVIRKLFLRTSNSQSELTALESVVLYKMIHHQKINLTYLIINQIQNALTANNIDNYPHGQIVTFIVLHWRTHALTTPIDDARIKIIRESTLRRQGFSQDNGRLVWYNKEERPARKCQRGARCSKDRDESASEGEDVAARPRRSIHDQLNALEEGQVRLHRDFEELRDSVHRHHMEQQSWYSGIVRFLTCWGKKHGATDEDLAHLKIPSTSGPSSPP
ncbi:hypothetical protein LIER_12133 [Lithospermum erythrorhizon]|uniref:Uncharacterized protein n=1 Tax=Lithospermum erythrorhizon TaxID=34254 RepID=A0AAV3PUX1_LITER